MKRPLILLPLLSALLASCGQNILSPSAAAPTSTPGPQVTLAASFLNKPAGCLLMDSQNNLYVDLSGSIAKISSSGVTSTMVAASSNLSPISHGLAYDGTYFYQSHLTDLLQVNTNGSVVTISGSSIGFNGVAMAPNSSATVYAPAYGSGNGSLMQVPASNFNAAATMTLFNCGALTSMSSLTVDANGNYYYGTNGAIVKYNGSAAVTIVGTGTGGNSDGPVASAQISNSTFGIVLDNQGNLYFTDNGNDSVRELTVSGQVKTLVGIPSANVTPIVTQSLGDPFGIAVDSNGAVYFTDRNNNVGLVYKYVP